MSFKINIQRQILKVNLVNRSGSGVDQVQSDWEQTDDTQKDFIKNKPEIPESETKESIETKLEVSELTTNNKVIVLAINEVNAKIPFNSQSGNLLVANGTGGLMDTNINYRNLFV